MVLPRGRRLLALVVVALAVASGAALAIYGPRRAARVAKGVWKVWKGRAEATDLPALGRNGRGLPIVERLLEAKLESKDADVRRGALLGLVRGFPDNRHARAVREYEALAGVDYFDGAWDKVMGSTRERGARREVPLAEAIARWRTFVAENPDFPGRDDAGLRLARCREEAGDAPGAFHTLLAARTWGDGDARFVIEDRIANILDAELTLEETLELARGSTNALVVYSAAVKLARARRLEEAAAFARRMIDLAAKGDVDLLGHSPHYFVWRDETNREVVKKAEFVEDVKRQRALWLELSACQPLDRAERLLEEPHAFENLVLHESVRSDREGHTLRYHETCDERFASYTRARNHLAQAAALFDDAAARRPASRLRALAGAAAARIGLANYWGLAAGHRVAGDEHARIDEAALAVRAALRETPLDRLPSVAARLLEAIDGSLPPGTRGFIGYQPADLRAQLDRRLTDTADANTTLALRDQESSRGR